METIRESEFLLGVFNSIPNPIFVLNKKSLFAFANLAFCELTGIPLHRIEGMDLDQVFTQEISTLFKENAGGMNNREIVIRTQKDKTKLFLVSVLKACFENSALELFTLKDLSDVRRAEESLLESEYLYKTLVNQLPNPILIHIGGNVVFANDLILEIAGLNKDEIIGKNVAELLSDATDSNNGEIFRNITGDSFAEESEFEIRTENRKVVLKNFLLRNRKIRYKGNDAIMTILIDITERKHLEKYVLGRMLEMEEKNRTQFAADLHDDLGPILSSIKLHLGLLEYSKSPEKFSETLKICNQQLDETIAKMRVLANNLMPRLLEKFGLEAAIGSFINTMQREEVFSIGFASKLKGRRFSKQTELHFYRILCELINNTIKHAGATNATIKLNYSKNTLTLEYSDNGKGYDVGEISKKTGGLGVGNIIQRVNLIDAEIHFVNKNGKTEVRIRKEF